MIRSAIVATSIYTLADIFCAAAQNVMVFGGGEVDLQFPQEGSTREVGTYAEVEWRGCEGVAVILGRIGANFGCCICRIRQATNARRCLRNNDNGPDNGGPFSCRG